MGIDIFFNDSFINLMSVRKSAVAKYGRPQMFNFNNGKAYKNKQMELLSARIGSVIHNLQSFPCKKQIYEINKEIEKAKLLKASQAKRSEYGDCSKYVISSAADKKGNETDGKIKVSLNEESIKKSLELAGYNMLVTSEISMPARDVYEAYHNLWRIEESFRIMKSQLDARPVYLQKKGDSS